MKINSVLNISSWGGGEESAVGEGYRWIYHDKFYSILYTRGGMYRGNHVHPVIQHTLLLSGKGKYVFKEKGENKSYNLELGKILDVPAKMPHIFLPEKDCLTVEWWEGDFEAEEYDFPEYTTSIKKKIQEFEKDRK